MAETVPGGVYLNPDGKTYHDSEGKEVKPEVVAEAQRLQREQSEHKLANYSPLPNQSTEALAEAVRTLIRPQAQPVQPQNEPEAPAPTDGNEANEPEAPAPTDGNEAAERRSRRA